MSGHVWSRRDCQNVVVIGRGWWLQIKPVSDAEVPTVLVTLVRTFPLVFVLLPALPRRHDLTAFIMTDFVVFSIVFWFSLRWALRSAVRITTRIRVGIHINASVNRFVILNDDSSNGSISALSVSVDVKIILIDVVERDRVRYVVDIYDGVIDRLEMSNDMSSMPCRWS